MTRFQIFRARLRDRMARGVILEARFWSLLLIVGALLRASSYFFRPPEALTPTSARIEGVLSYPVWSVILLTYAALIALGTFLPEKHAPEAWLGHVIGVMTTAALASSILGAAIIDGDSWSGFWPLVVVMFVHAGRANALGPQTRTAVADGCRWLPGRRV